MFAINRIWYQVCWLDCVVNTVLCTSLICVWYRWSLYITHIKLILVWYNFNGVNCQFEYLKLHISWNGLIFSWYRLCVCVSIWYILDVDGLYITYIRLIPKYGSNISSSYSIIYVNQCIFYSRSMHIILENKTLSYQTGIDDINVFFKPTVLFLQRHCVIIGHYYYYMIPIHFHTLIAFHLDRISIF